MAVSDSAYLEWLQDDDKYRVVLAVAEHYAGTEYFSTHPFVSGPAASIASMPFVDTLVDIPVIRRSIDGRTSFGNLEVINDGSLDAWVEYQWRGYSIDIYFGDKDWDFDDFRKVLSGTNDGIVSASNQQIAFRIYDKRKFFDIVLPMTDNNYEQKIPIALGKPFNTPPVLKSYTSPVPVYYACDATCTVDNVRDDGVNVDGTITDNGDGTFDKDNSTSGELRVDIIQADDTLSEMVLNICSRISFTDIDTTQVNAFANTAILGLFVARETYASKLMDDICNSFGAFWSFSREGLLQVHQFTGDLTTADHVIYTDNIIDGEGKFTEVIDPEEISTLNYKRNWKTQEEGILGGSVAPDTIPSFTEMWSNVTKTNTLTGYPIPIENDDINTLIIGATDAQTECDRRAAIRAEKHYLFKIECFAAPFLFEIGEIVEINYSRFSLDGVNMKIIEMQEYPTDNKVGLTLWM